MELHLTPETEAKLSTLAERTQRGADELLSQAVDYLIDYNNWFEGKVKASTAAAHNGPTVSNEDVAAWLEERERR